MLREERGELGLVHEIEAGKTSLFLYAIRLSSKDKKNCALKASEVSRLLLKFNRGISRSSES